MLPTSVSEHLTTGKERTNEKGHSGEPVIQEVYAQSRLCQHPGHVAILAPFLCCLSYFILTDTEYLTPGIQKRKVYSHCLQRLQSVLGGL